MGRQEGGVFYRILMLQVVMILVAGVGVLWWAGRVRVEVERREFREVSSSQARLAGDLGLPLSGELAGRFQELGGYEVGFLLEDGGLRTGGEWPEEKLEVAWRALKGEAGRVVVGGDWEGVGVPVGERGVKLVALKERSRVMALEARSEWVWAVGAGVLLAMGSALALARSRSRLAEEEERRKSAERMALLGKMATSLAHEIKNPAAAIVAQARGLEGTEKGEVGAMIREDAEEIVSLVHQWLYVARPEPPGMGEVDLGDLLEDLKARLEAWVRFYRCELRVEREGELGCRGDGARLEQVFRNLIQNAVQAMPRGGVVTVSLVGRGEEVRFEVKDEGRGFSEEALGAFGEAFFSEREGGIGLGLALVKGVVEAHGGEVKAGNLPGGGGRVMGALAKEGGRK